ncbi:MAG: radical SAM protein [Chlorobiaceae bacterium]|nr:radical SAM protein [Chlorobiaceae bacterium]
MRQAPQHNCRTAELTFYEIKRIVDEARVLGTRKWSISGGEPMLRPDFPDIFDYITSKSVSYSLNTNGTLITPEIARLLIRKGVKMVALYGATRETYTTVTRNPNGFDQLMQGFRYLNEAGASFIVQLIPMQANWHEWAQMINLAKSLSPVWRVGAPWLFLSSDRNTQDNDRIAAQRLDPKIVVELDPPDLSQDTFHDSHCGHSPVDGCFFAGCIAERRIFHIDPYGGMSICSFVKDPSMRYDLRKGSVEEGWEIFIPSLGERRFDVTEYNEHCGSCESKDDCQWCGVFGWLEHGRYGAPVESLCQIARETTRSKQLREQNHRRYFMIADITIRVDSDLPIDEKTFDEKFRSFAVAGPGTDTVSIHHYFEIPDFKEEDCGKELYRRTPWAISQKNGVYIYRGISSDVEDQSIDRMVTCGIDHNDMRIYHGQQYQANWRNGGLHSLTMLPTDQILIARLLADRQGFYLHSAGAIINGAGMLFVGHSQAGKSTTTNFLIEAGLTGRLTVEILCDDRNIVRSRPEGWRVYGTWSHGDVPLVSSASAPLKAICFIDKAEHNRIEVMEDGIEMTRRLLACLIRPFVTAEWWEKTLDLIAKMVKEVPCYRMQFDKSGLIVDDIARIARSDNYIQS